MCFTEPPDDEPAAEPQPRRPSLSSHERERHQPESRAELARHRRMRLTLLELQRTMDPLIAAHAYNNRYNGLARLPDEILLMIVTFCLSNDLIDLYCLRRVSTRFRRIVYEPEIRRWVLNPQWSGAWSYSERKWDLSIQQCQELRHRLHRDGMCDMCLDRRDFPMDDPRVWSSPGHGPVDALRTPPWSRCRFSSERRARLHCDGCGTHHDAKAFRPCDFGSNEDRLCLGGPPVPWRTACALEDRLRLGGPPVPWRTACAWEDRLCLGQRGGVRMCEHVVIFWDDIKTHIRSRRKRNPGEPWQACLESFGVECRDPGHDSRCAAEQAGEGRSS